MRSKQFVSQSVERCMQETPSTQVKAIDFPIKEAEVPPTFVEDAESMSKHLKTRLENAADSLRDSADLTIKELNEFLNEGFNWVEGELDEISEFFQKPPV